MELRNAAANPSRRSAPPARHPIVLPPPQLDHQAHLDVNTASAPSSPFHCAAAATARPPHQARLDLDAAGAPSSPSHGAVVASPSNTLVPPSGVIPTQDSSQSQGP
ncbi:unnamed protein product [Urochloa humidicola]